MKRIPLALLGVIAMTANAAVDPKQYPITAQACSYAQSFIINAYANINNSSTNPLNAIETNINNTRNIDMRVGARVANNFLASSNAWAPQYAQWARQNILPYCKSGLGSAL